VTLHDDEPRVGRVLTTALAGPVCASLALLVWFIGSEAAGRTPFAYPMPHNIAEAAGMARAAEVLRFLRAGADPGAVEDVRPEIVSRSITRVSAVEAAIWGREVALVRMLDREGALAGGGRRQYLACLATSLQATDIVAYLAPHGVEGCDPAGVVRQIEARRQ
jgi:hypothetical protein